MKINIAIDGPVASGKTTVARMLAAELGYIYIDTGAMYRALTWKALQSGLSMSDEEKICDVASKSHIRFENTEKNTSGYLLFLDNIDITDHLTDVSVRKNVSALSAISGVRRILVEEQKNMALKKGVIMAGRDITTVVLKDAEVKIYLTASPEERAVRRHKEITEKGEVVTYEALLEEIKKRDFLDSTRKDSPLTVASDAIVLDCTDKNQKQVVEEIIDIVNKCCINS